jgi:hypothetical protein
MGTHVDRTNPRYAESSWGEWLSRHLEALLDSHLTTFADELAMRVAEWLVEEPCEYQMDFSDDPPWDCSGRPVPTGRSLRLALGRGATVGQFLESYSWRQRPTYLSGMGLITETWGDWLLDEYEYAFEEPLVELLLADTSDPEVATFRQWATDRWEEEDPDRQNFTCLIEWVSDNSGSCFGADTENVLSLDSFYRPLAYLESMTVPEVMKQWGEGARQTLAARRAAEEEARAAAQEAAARRAEAIAYWMPRFRLAVGTSRSKFNRVDLHEVRIAMDRIGLHGDERRVFVQGTTMWSNSLRSDLQKEEQ